MHTSKPLAGVPREVYICALRPGILGNAFRAVRRFAGSRSPLAVSSRPGTLGLEQPRRLWGPRAGEVEECYPSNAKKVW